MKRKTVAAYMLPASSLKRIEKIRLAASAIETVRKVKRAEIFCLFAAEYGGVALGINDKPTKAQRKVLMAHIREVAHYKAINKALRPDAKIATYEYQLHLEFCKTFNAGALPTADKRGKKKRGTSPNVWLNTVKETIAGLARRVDEATKGDIIDGDVLTTFSAAVKALLDCQAAVAKNVKANVENAARAAEETAALAA